MEERQLNFDAPILSARRYASPSNSSKILKQKVAKPSKGQQALQSNRSDFENDRVTKPGAVPFQWEEIPGTPKHYAACQGRESGSPRHDPGERCYDQSISWPKPETISLTNCEHLNQKLDESCKDGSDTEYDSYSDTIVTLSRIGSGSLNFRVQDMTRSSGSFIVDKETRDLMMRRFLPAARAAVRETPEHIVKKSPLPDEQPKQERREVPKDSMASPNRYDTNPSPYYSRYMEVLEAEDGKQKCIVPRKKPWKGWGVLPGFLAKHSMPLSNPSLQLKQRSVTSPPSTSKVHFDPLSKVRRLAAKAKSGPLNKNAFPLIHKAKFHSGCLPREMPQVDDDGLPDDPDEFSLNNQDLFKPELSPLKRYNNGAASPHRNDPSKSPLSRYRIGTTSPNWNEYPKSPVSHHGSHCASPSRYEPPNSQFRSHATSPYRNRLPKSPLGHLKRDDMPPHYNESLKDPSHVVGFVDPSEETEYHSSDEIAPSREPFKAMQEVSRDQAGDASVKTLYMYAKSSHKNAGGPVISYSEKKNAEEQTGGKYYSSTSMSDPMEQLCHKFRSTVSFPASSSCYTIPPQDIKANHISDQDIRTMECISKVIRKERRKERELYSHDMIESSHPVKHSLLPPLPDSPTEPWLWRSTHSLATGNSYAQSHRTIHSKGDQGQKSSALDTEFKKASNLRGDHGRHYPGETPYAWS